MKQLSKVIEFMENDFHKATDLISKVLTRKLDATVYKDSTDRIYKNNIGTFSSNFYFIGDSDNAIRLNWIVGDKSRKIKTVDVFKNNKQITIDLNGNNINKVIDVVVSAYKEPEAVVGADIIVEQLEKQSLSKITETAFHASNGGVYSSKRVFIKDQIRNGMTNEDIWRDVPKSTFNVTLMTQFRDEIAKQPQSPVGGVVSVALAQPEQQLYSSKVQNSITDYEELEKEYWSDPDVVYDDLVSLVSTVGQGNVNSLIVSGDGGVGKTYRVKQTLKSIGKKEGVDFIMLSGGGTPLGIYKKLFQHREKVVVLDDFDDVWKDPKSVNILKAVLDTTDPRQVDYASTSKQVFRADGIEDKDLEFDDRYVKEDAVPDSFLFKGQCIFVTNLYKYQLDDAVLSRSLAIDIAIKQKDMIKLMEKLAPEMDLGISERQQKEIIDILNDDVKDYEDEIPTEIIRNGIQRKKKTLRTMINSAGIIKSGVPNYKRLIKKYA